ncbi:biotin/lipoyl-containing protein [Streptomyces sp. B1866]|uniref:acetyl-CoA carboxylase biotin carboxyl carrier protein n=1 Tax=Streptomyces sp. B1866 TaxID=3075431 RepID=UPI00288F1ACA|nr:biotin/lipoyl-containing protein [Streptomyces sp. B1866]MDT3397992.1 biotin/lipoyl-containing protein [Streptomyces sp. B1866]
MTLDRSTSPTNSVSQTAAAPQASDPAGHGDPLTNGHRPGAVVLTSQASLESVCRSVTELVRAASRHPCRIRLRHGETTVEMEWPGPAAPPRPAGPDGAAAADAAPAAPDAPAGDAGAAAREGQPAGPARVHVCAPTVGTFYRSPEPGAPPFVAVGDVVQPGQPVGILEVMKMMSPVEARTAGRVVEILVPDARPVEYEQPLVALEPLSADESG